MDDIVDAFKAVMMVMPRDATNPNYPQFIKATRDSSVSIFNLSKSPDANYIIPVSTSQCGFIAKLVWNVYWSVDKGTWLCVDCGIF